MSGPTRWRDAASTASPAVRDLLNAGRRSSPLPSASRARSAARVARLAAAPPSLTMLASFKGIASSAALGAAAAVLVVGVAGLLEARVTPPPEPAPVVAPAPMTSASPSASASASPSTSLSAAPRPRPTASASAPRRAVTIEPIPPTPVEPPPLPAQGAADTLGQEAAILEQARAALAIDPARALIKLDEHAARFPAGKLGLERELMAVKALQRLGHAEPARARGEALLPGADGTPYEPTVRRLLKDLK